MAGDVKHEHFGRYIRVSVGAIGTLISSVAFLLYAEIQRVHDALDDHIETAQKTFSEYKSEVSTALEKKADKGSTADRYTGEDAKRDFESYERTNKQQHESLRREIDHLHDDLDSHGHNHSEIDHDK